MSAGTYERGGLLLTEHFFHAQNTKCYGREMCRNESPNKHVQYRSSAVPRLDMP